MTWFCIPKERFYKIPPRPYPFGSSEIVGRHTGSPDVFILKHGDVYGFSISGDETWKISSCGDRMNSWKEAKYYASLALSSFYTFRNMYRSKK